MFGTFVLGAALLAVSVGLDQFFGGLHLFEDGAKLLGTLVWLTLPMVASRPAAVAGVGTGTTMQ